MKLARPTDIRAIDAYASETLGIPPEDLMRRSGRAIADAVRARTPRGGTVVILAGKGNNGGDGYAAACELIGEYEVTVYDIFSAGQSTAEGQKMLADFLSRGGRVEKYEATPPTLAAIRGAGCIVDAIFGTGFSGEMPEAVSTLALTVRGAVGAHKIAVDVPLGVNADDGSILTDSVITVGTTVELSFVKRGIVSYPGRAYVGEIVYCDLGLPIGDLSARFSVTSELTDAAWARAHLPLREENSNKGTFGKLLLYSGSEMYRGAAALSLGGALRGGCGSVRYCGTESLCHDLSATYPEALYTVFPPTDGMGAEDLDRLTALSAQSSATLIGCGSADTASLAALVRRLLVAPGSPILLDADAINALAREPLSGREAIRTAARPVVLTPHPLEFSRLSGEDVNYVQLHRMECAMRFAAGQRCVLVLKGAATIITDGTRLIVNGTGSSGLAKAGSGDVLAGVMASLLAMGTDPMNAAALACYYHGLAADTLSVDLSSYGITPSDLPLAIAHQMAYTECERAEAEAGTETAHEEPDAAR